MSRIRPSYRGGRDDHSGLTSGAGRPRSTGARSAAPRSAAARSAARSVAARSVTALIGTGLLVGVLGAAAGCGSQPDRTDAAAAASSTAHAAVRATAQAGSRRTPETSAPATTARPTPSRTPETSAKPTPTAPPPANRAKRISLENVRVTGIGDSIMDMSTNALEQTFPHIRVDAVVGRQMWTLDNRITALGPANLGQVVVIGLGTNGTFAQSYLDRQIERLGTQRRVVLVNVHMPDSWQDEVDAKLRTAAKRFPNVTIADWYAQVEQNPELLGPDHTHPTTHGSQVYARMVANAVRHALAS